MNLVGNCWCGTIRCAVMLRHVTKRWVEGCATRLRPGIRNRMGTADGKAAPPGAAYTQTTAKEKTLQNTPGNPSA